jgi:WD40 repeat protein
VAGYDAFVSYSHAKDKPIAAALQSVVQKLGKPWYRRRALRLFRDDTSLSATPSLWPTIERSLGQSRFLILLASSEAATSPWVNKEVAWWFEHKSADTLLIAVTDGALAWDNTLGDFARSDSMPLPLPPAIAGRFASEPKWVDLTAYREGANPRDAKFIELAADFAAAIHDRPKEDLLSEELRQQRRALGLAWSAAAVLLLLALAAGGLGYLARQNERLANEQRRLAQDNERLANEQRDRAVTNQARFQAALSASLRAAGHVTEAALVAIEAFPAVSGGTRPPLPEIEDALFGSLLLLRGRAIIDGGEEIMAAAYSPDNARIVAATGWRAAIFDARSGGLLGVLQGHEDFVHGADFSPDGAFILTVSADKTARLWDAGLFMQRLSLRHPAEVRHAAFSPDGRTIATASFDGKIRLWNSATGTLIATLEGSGSEAGRVVFTRSGSRILAAFRNGSVRVWDARTRRPLATLDRIVDELMIAIGPDENRMLAVGAEGEAAIWDVAKKSKILSLKGHSERVFDAAFSPDGRRIATSSRDATVRLWDAGSGEEIAALRGHGGSIRSVQFSRDGTELLTGSLDRTIRLWDARWGLEVSLPAAGGGARMLSPDGTRLMTVPEGKPPDIWDVRSRRRIATLAGAVPHFVGTPFFSSDGKSIAGSPGGIARIWDADSGRELRRLGGEAEKGEALALSRDGRLLATAVDNGPGVIWDVPSGTIRATLTGHKYPILGATFSSDGSRILTVADGPSDVRVWDTRSGALISAFEPAVWDAFSTVDLSLDGMKVVAAEHSGIAIIWDAVTGAELARLEGHAGKLTASRFSPDGRLVVTAGEDGQIRVWQASTAREIFIFRGQSALVGSIDFSPDGDRLLADMADGALRIWSMRSGMELAVIKGRMSGKNSGASVAFSSDGNSVVLVDGDTFRQWQLPAAGPERLAHGLKAVPHCLPLERRAQLLLESDPAPPRWCIELQKWPYHTAEWKQWLADRDAGKAIPRPAAR